MDENKFKFFRYCTRLLIHDDNHSKIFISDDDDDCDKLVHYNNVLNDFERLVSVRNNIVNLIHNDKRKYNITLLVDYYKI